MTPDPAGPAPEPEADPEPATAAPPATAAAAPGVLPGDGSPPLGVDLLGRGLAARGPRGPVFARVDLDVPAGAVAVIHGPGGSGRSALLLALGGRLRLAAGELRVGDALAADGLAPLRAAAAVARIRPGLEPDEGLAVRDLERQATLATGGRCDPRRIADAYALLDLDPPRDALLGDLHPRDQLLVAVALVAAEHRPLVLVDDVDHGLTAADRAAAWAALDGLAAAGPTVIATALEPPEAIEHVAIALPHPSEHRRAVARDASADREPAA
ncbi:ATP-binding cassette domain-containing protein [Patulibacter defluvii]|uniref:ATP-binding cassette domain-containing protein n=1 Tax=Patulibacter defluvii TaxID=3095358 RepID=UPI002A758426|nr:ATP-binding cassette domain-containing protein [Patulibacter sp. DM4]